MPETRLERVFATIGMLAVVGLIAVVVPGVLEYRREASAASGKQAASAGGTAAATPVRERPVPDRGVAIRVPVKLVLTATRGDCWVEVHAGSAAGDVLYEDLLAKGAERTFSARALWIRLGASQNLDATLDGRPVDKLPTGTADVLVTRRGVRPAPS